MTNQSPPNTLMIVLPTPWNDGFYERVSSTYLEIWDCELFKESVDPKSEDASGMTGILTDGDRRATWSCDPAVEHLAESIAHSHPPFAESEQLIAAQHKVSWRLSIESPSYEDARFIVRLMAAVTANQTVATLIPSTGRAFPPTFTRQLSASDEVESIISFFVHAWTEGTTMRTRGLTAFGFPEVETEISGGKNESYFNLLDLSASILLDGMPALSRTIDLGNSQYELGEMVDPAPDPENPIAGFYGVVKLAKKIIH